MKIKTNKRGFERSTRFQLHNQNAADSLVPWIYLMLVLLSAAVVAWFFDPALMKKTLWILAMGTAASLLVGLLPDANAEPEVPARRVAAKAAKAPGKAEKKRRWIVWLIVFFVVAACAIYLYSGMKGLMLGSAFIIGLALVSFQI